MSDVVKWGLLAAGVAILIGLVMVLPVGNLSLIGNVGTYLNSLLTVCGGALNSARGLINCFLFEEVRPFLSGLMIWLLFKWAASLAVKITAWIYHFVLRG